MSSTRFKLLRFFVPLALVLVVSAPSAEKTTTHHGVLDFSAFDGSSEDADGLIDGIWTVPHSMVLEGRLACDESEGSSEPASKGCVMELRVEGDLVLQPGSAITAGEGVKVVVAGDLLVNRGSFVVSDRGTVEISARGQIVVDGLVSANGPRGPTSSASVVLESTGGPGKGVRVGASGTVLSAGESKTGNRVELSGCGLEVLGFVASVGNGPGARVVMRSCEGLVVDGTELEDPNGLRRGRIEVQGAGASQIDLFAQRSVDLDGAELRVVGGEGNAVVVTSDLGGLSWRRGLGAVGSSGEIHLTACDGVDLTGSRLALEAEIVEVCAGEPKVKPELPDPGNGLSALPPVFSGEGLSDEPGPLGPATPCTPNLAVDNLTITTIEEFISCNVLTSENTRIIPRGYVTYRAKDSIELGNGFSVEGSATFIAIIDPTLNDSPVAEDDAVTTDEDTALMGDVLVDNGSGADSDPDGDPLTVTEVNGNAANVGVQIPLASGALLTANSDGTFSYDPNGAFDALSVGDTATDSFTYQIGDGNGGFDTATVTVTVTGVNDPPVAEDDAVTTDEDTALMGDVLVDNGSGADSDVEGDPLTVTEVNGNAANVGVQIPLASGALLTANSDGTFGYDPNSAFDALSVGDTATDSFTYQIGDGNGGFDTATVTVTVTGVNDPPVAEHDAVTTDEDTALMGDVLVDNGSGADSDVEGDPLTVTEVNGNAANVGVQIPLASGALLTANANGTFSYDPNGAFEALGVGDTATDSFTYQIGDGNGGFDAATVTVTVTGISDPPVITSDLGGPTAAVSVPENQTAVTNVQALDPEGETEGAGLSYGLSGTDMAFFTIDVNTGVLSFTSPPNFETPLDDGTNNTYEVTVTVTDSGALTDVQALTVTVTDVLEPTPGQNFSAALGDFDDTKSLTLQFEATVDAAFPKGLGQVFNQAQVAADGPITVLSDPTTTVIDRAPQVAALFVNDTTWAPAFRNELATRGVGDASLGYAVPGGLANGEDKSQLDTLPWTGVDEISLRFTEDVDVELVDLQLQSITPISVTGFSYNAGTFTATWSLGASLGSNKVRTVADGTSAAPNGVRDAAGNQTLDGEWLDGVAAFSSGDGAEGGDFSFRFNIQPADVNGDGLTTAADTAAVQALNGTPIGPGYSIFHDLNGDGTIDGSDQALAAGVEGSAQPAAEPAGTPASGWVPDAAPPAAPPAGTVAPPITVSKSAVLVVDVDGDGQADPADTLRYEVVVTNLSGGVASNLVFTDAGAYPNTTLGDRGPAALPDSYQPMGVLVVPAATGLRANDFDIDGVTPPGSLVVISATPVGVPQGTLDLMGATDGSFTYTPPAMGSGVDTFNYSVLDTDGLVGTGQVMFVLNTPPMIATDPIAYTTAGNTQLKGGSGAMSTAVAFVEDAGNIPTKAGVTDAETPGSLVFSLDSGPTNGSATVSAAGNFLYTPNPGFVGGDSFDYAVSDGSLMVTGTVNVTVTDTNGVFAGNQVIWYVENNAAAGGTGTSASPFDTLKNAESGGGASSAGDTIFVLEGDTTTAKQNAGLVLETSQKLVGHAATTLVANSVTIQTPSPGGRPKIDHATGGDGVEATDKNGVEIRNLEITGDVHGIDFAASSGAPTLVIDNNVLTGSAGGHGVNVVATGTAAPEVAFSNNKVESTDASFRGASFDGSASSGTMVITSFPDNSVSDTAAAVGTGIRIANATFDADTGSAGIQQVAAGDLTVGDSGGALRTMGAGLSLIEIKGDLQFDSVDIFNSDGPGLMLDNTALSAGDFTLTIDDGTPTSVIDTQDGSALDLDRATVTMNLLSATTSTAGAGFAAAAIRLVDLVGTVDIDGGSLAGATGTSFAVSGGTVTSTYSGGITHTGTGAAVSVSGGHSIGTVSFDTGTVSATAGTGLQFSNADGTYNFNGTTTLNGGDAGIDIVSGSNGTFTFGSGSSITNPSGIAVNIDTSTGGNVNYSGTISQNNAASAVKINAKTGGMVTFSGTVTATTTTAPGINLTANGGGTVNFNGGLNVDTTTGIGFVATGGGTVNISATGGDESIASTSAKVLDLNGVTAGITFDAVSSMGSGVEGVDIAGVGGTVVLNGGSIGSATGTAFKVDGGTATIAYAGTINNSSNRSVEVVNRGAGAGNVTFSGAITHAGTNAVRVASNAAGTVAFNGAVDITNTTAAGVSVQSNTGGTTSFADLDIDNSTSNQIGIFAGSNGGAHTLNVSTGTIDAGSGRAVDIDGTILGINLVSVDSVGGGVPGIDLNTTTGSFTVAGSGSGCRDNVGLCSGGSITGKTGNTDGVLLSNVTNVSLNDMNISSNTRNGIFGTNVNGFQIFDSRLIDNADTDNPNESGIDFDGLTGTALAGSNPTRFSNIRVEDSHEHNVEIRNMSGTLTELRVENSIFSNDGASAVAGNNFNFLSQGTASMTLNVQSSEFIGNRTGAGSLTGSGVFADGQSSATLGVTVQSSLFEDNNNAINVSHTGSGAVTFNILNNGTVARPIAGNLSATEAGGAGAASTAINVVMSETYTGNASGDINGNIIGISGVTESGSATSSGILADIEGTGSLSVEIDGNTVRETDSRAIRAWAQNPVGGLLGPGGTLNVKATGNTIDQVTSFGVYIRIRDESSNLCAKVEGNVVTNTSSTHVRVREEAGTGRLEVGSANLGDTPLQVLTTNNPGASTWDGEAGLTVVTNGTCGTF